MSKVRHNLRYILKPGTYLPAAQVRLWDDKKWERFVEKCCRVHANSTLSHPPRYIAVKRLGGKGDKGRDIEALMSKPRAADRWDLYQCKHYKNPLNRGDLYPELVKFFSHLAKGSYPPPAHYFICAPLDCGNDLHDLLSNDSALKLDFLSAWLNGDLGLSKPSDDALAYARGFDFSRIAEVTTSDLIAIHAADLQDHFKLFGITPERPEDGDVPIHVGAVEHQYAQALLEVYSEHNGTALTLATVDGTGYNEHFQSCRAEFFCAEGLARFSRDLYADADIKKDPFRLLLTQIHKGVKSTLTSPRHRNGLERLDAVLGQVSTLQTNDNPLQTFLRPGDLPGTCHHLANEGEIKWVR
jgi:hypothetical protein